MIPIVQILAMIGAFLLGFVVSTVLLLFVFYLLIKLPKQQRTKPFQQFFPIHLPQKLLKLVQSSNWKKQRQTVIVMNLIMQCIFREWKDSITLRRVVLSKLNKEFADMVQRGAAGKLLEKIQLRELDFGTDFLTITRVAVENVTLHDTWKTIEELDVFLALEYAGGFTLAVDADLIIGGQVSLSVKITHLSGKARLQFSRKPYSHWSFAFYEEPKVEISIESSIQGQNFPQIPNIIMSQIRRVLRAKHTLPNYRIRFKPICLFPELRINPPLKEKLCQTGQLEVTVVECSRLVLGEGSYQLYCMLSLDESQWINMDKLVGTPWINLELEIQRPKSAGIELKQALIEGKFREVVMVESVSPDSSFAAAGVIPGDVITFIRNQEVTDAKQALKLFSKGGEKVIIKVERKSEYKWQKSAQEGQHMTEVKTKVDHTQHTTAADEVRTKAAFAAKASIATLLIAGSGKQKKIVGDSNEILSRAKAKGFPIKRTTFVVSTKTAIPLAHILGECTKTAEAYYCQVFKLLCPEFTQLPKEFIKYAMLAGFDPRLCYGDITMSFVFKGWYKTKSLGAEDEAQACKRSTAPPADEAVDNLMDVDSSPTIQPAAKSLIHVFEEVTLKKSINCKFCNNRIWLRKCLRCTECRMIIHKKCEALCKQKTICKQVIWPDEDVVEETKRKGESDSKITGMDSKSTDSVQKSGKEERSSAPAVIPVPGSADHKVEEDRKFFKSLEMNADAENLNHILDSLSHRIFDLRLFAIANEQAKFLHDDLKGDERRKRIENVYQKVKAVFEKEKQNKEKLSASVAAATGGAKSEAETKLAQCGKRLKAINLVLLYYACGLKRMNVDHPDVAIDGDKHSEGEMEL
ncbi:PDZ domain-containing protein 8-like isoform X2 [Ornithodoros turicata]|uniref:PDZ domain-containing protein 8-like isoform X2 n=1 Tax=Ornithodoros turicata TaxID=34597 RepID=UPI00313A21A4